MGKVVGPSYAYDLEISICPDWRAIALQRVKSDGRDFHDGPVLELKFMQKWAYLRQLTLEKNQRLLKMYFSK